MESIIQIEYLICSHLPLKTGATGVFHRSLSQIITVILCDFRGSEWRAW